MATVGVEAKAAEVGWAAAMILASYLHIAEATRLRTAEAVAAVGRR
tara:strand:+ start:1583 stop:1720 length:138 start_codon:yes stop_codon:yes gene_type:complete